MSYKISLIAVLVLLMGAGFAQGQTRSEATDTGAALVGGGVSFSSQGGDLYGGSDDDRLTTLAIVPSLFYFVAPGIGIGGNISYDRMSQGDASFTTWGVGPQIGYFMDSGGNAIPFVAGGVNFLSIGNQDDSESGFRFKFGGGVLIRKDHMAVSIEAAYVIDRYKFEGAEEAITGNTIVIGIGFGGFLY
jgi:hypothetical protein